METADFQTTHAIHGSADAARIIREKIESFMPEDPLFQAVIIPEIKIFINDLEFSYNSYQQANLETLEPIHSIKITYPVVEDAKQEIDYHCVRCGREIRKGERYSKDINSKYITCSDCDDDLLVKGDNILTIE